MQVGIIGRLGSLTSCPGRDYYNRGPVGWLINQSTSLVTSELPIALSTAFHTQRYETRPFRYASTAALMYIAASENESPDLHQRGLRILRTNLAALLLLDVCIQVSPGISMRGPRYTPSYLAASCSKLDTMFFTPFCYCRSCLLRP